MLTVEQRKEKSRKAAREWYWDNKELAASKNKVYCKVNRKILTEKNRSRIKVKRDRWMKIIKEQGKDHCMICGYKKCFAALDFHHRDPKTKKRGVAYFLDKLITQTGIDELNKCDALCKNCHTELHAKERCQL